MKTVYYEPAGRVQNAQWDLINYPPRGYQFTTKTKKGLLDKIVDNSFMFNSFRLQVLDKALPLNLVKAALTTTTPKGTDMIYSYNHIVTERTPKTPWVVQVEWPHILIGREPYWVSQRFLRKVEERLLGSNCKKIFTWTQAAKEALRMYPHGGVLQAKTEVIPPAMSSKPNIERTYNKKIINLLFVGSINDIHDFELKGGLEVMEATYALKENYKKIKGGYKIHLTIRARVPRYLKEEASKGHTMEILDQQISKEKLDSLYREADIFVFPSHLAHNHTPLEAMSYGLPVVTTYIGSTFGEYVEDGKTGLVGSPLESTVKYFTKGGLLRSETTERLQMVKEAQSPNYTTVEFLIKSMSKLIEDPELRKKMGEAGRKEIDGGRFSIKGRNEKLKKIFDEVLR
ncbi:MAG: glycosyltransferase family 4 protein [Proteobacteria bacterium]|nr:glycosyltransferase family 4 protein [Pseudomonadota bacterium]